MQPDKQYLRLFFDMDGTLTRSRTKIAPEMKELLTALPYDLVVMSGAALEQMRFQLDGLSCYTMAQNGNHAVHGGEVLWEDALNTEEIQEIESHIAQLPRRSDIPDVNDLLENRGSQISFSIYGHHAPVATKEEIDPDQAIRTRLLSEHPFVSDTVEVKIAGTTCLDYFKKGRNKGFNVIRLCQMMSWQPETCVYFGDALYPNGNDETVIGIIDTETVANPADTYEKLQALKR